MTAPFLCNRFKNPNTAEKLGNENWSSIDFRTIVLVRYGYDSMKVRLVFYHDFLDAVMASQI